VALVVALVHQAPESVALLPYMYKVLLSSFLLLSLLGSKSTAQTVIYGNSNTYPFSNEILLEKQLNPTCLNTIKQVMAEIKAKGGKGIAARYSTSSVNRARYYNMPKTINTGHLTLILGSSSRDNPYDYSNRDYPRNSEILMSLQLQTQWANTALQGCPYLLEVWLGMAQSDWINSFVINEENKMVEQVCIDLDEAIRKEENGTLSWYETGCL
jgi:hypothetical protein